MANVVSPMVGKLVSIDVKVGDEVKANDAVATIEAMKMMVKVFAPADGKVAEIKANAGDTIDTETVIMTLE